MSYTAKSCSSFDTNEYIDLDTALVEEELRSLGASPDTSRDNYRISFKSVDARETERLRNSLVTPMTNYSSLSPRSVLKSPTESYAESVALFKNLANNDHIDLVSSDLKDFMGNCDMDDLMSRPGSRPNTSSSPQQPHRHNKDSLTSSRLNSHNKNHTLLQKLSKPTLHQTTFTSQNEPETESNPFGHTSNGYANPVTHTHKPTTNNNYKQSLNDSANTNKPKSRTLQSILNKRRSLDSDGLKKSQENTTEPSKNDSKVLLKRHSMLSISEYEPATPSPTKLKLPNSRMPLSTNKDSMSLRRNSSLQQPLINSNTNRRGSSNIQQPANTNSTLQTRSSNQQHSTTYNPPSQRRNSSLQKKTDNRRWSSYIPDQTQGAAISEDQLPQAEIKFPQTRMSSASTQYASTRQEPRKLLNRHSMVVPASRRLSRENIYEDIHIATASRRNVSYDNDQTNPSANANLQSTTEKARRRHTISASDKRALAQQLANKTVLPHSTNQAQDEDYHQVDVEHKLQKRYTINNDRRPHVRTSSYERSIEEPNRYRSKLRNPTREDQDQLSTTLRNTVLSNSKYISHHELQHQGRSFQYNDVPTQPDNDEAAYYRSDLTHTQANESEPIVEHIETPSRYSNIRVNTEQRHTQLPASIQRRTRALSVPSSQQQPDEKYYTDKPSLMPVPVRFRKHSNNSISKYASVPENAGLTSFSPPKDVRFGATTTNNYPEEIRVEASRSSGGLSNSTASSSHSSDKYYDPPTPPTSAVITQHHIKRRSMPVMNASMIDEQVRKTENRYTSYLARIKKDSSAGVGLEHVDNASSRHQILPRGQRVLSEDNENYKHQLDQRRKSQQQVYRDEDTEDVILSAKHLLSIVKERRNRAH